MIVRRLLLLCLLLIGCQSEVQLSDAEELLLPKLYFTPDTALVVDGKHVFYDHYLDRAVVIDELSLDKRVPTSDPNIDEILIGPPLPQNKNVIEIGQITPDLEEKLQVS